MKSLLTHDNRRAYYLVSRYASPGGEVGWRPASLPLGTSFKSEWSPSPKAMSLFPWCHSGFTDLNRFGTGQCIAVTMLIAADRPQPWRVGTLPTGLLSPWTQQGRVWASVSPPLCLQWRSLCCCWYWQPVAFVSWLVRVLLLISSQN